MTCLRLSSPLLLTILATAAIGADPVAPVPPVPSVPAVPPQPPVPAAEPGEVHSAAASETISLANVTDAKQVSAMRLYVTDDGSGVTWTMAEEITVPQTADRLPTFSFAAPRDGRYGFRTAAANRKGDWEPAPQAGQRPNQILVVDRTPPTLDRFDAAAAAGGTGLTIQASWKCSDVGFSGDPVLLEASIDGGRTFQQVHTGPVEGSATIPLAITAATESVALRLTARDRAGNVLTAPPRIVPVPVAARPVEPEQALAQAVGRLPATGDLGVDVRPATVPPVVDAPAPIDASAPAAPAKPAVRAARPAPPAVNAPKTGRPVAPAKDTPYLRGDPAQEALDAALAKVKEDPDAALDALLPLHHSTVARQAVEAELPLLRERGDLLTLIGVVEALQPEIMTDAFRLERARALYAIGKYDQSIKGAAGVRANSEQARPAKLLIARCLDALQKPVEAGRIYDSLVNGSDEVAAIAKSER